MKQRILFQTLFLSLILMIYLSIVPVLAQDPPTQDETVSSLSNIEEITLTEEGWVIPFHLLGQGESIRLTGHVSQRDYFLPMPDGMKPLELRARPITSRDVLSGYVEVRSEDQILALFDLPSPTEEISIPLENAVIRDNVLHLTLTARMRSVDDICETQLVGAWLDLQNPTYIIEDEALEAPDSVRTFFPPLLTQLKLYTPQNPTIAEAQAALQIVSAVVAQTPGQRQIISVETLDESGTIPNSADTRWHERQIIIREGEETRISLVAQGSSIPILSISGTAETLPLQSEFFIEEAIVALGITNQIRVFDVATDQDFPDRIITFERLGFKFEQVTGMGRIEIPFDITQSDLGRPSHISSMRIVGTYTPLHEGAQATLSVLFNQSLMRAILLDDTGHFDLTIPVATKFMQRDNELRMRIEYTPIDGLCRIGMQPITVEFDSGSYLTIEALQTLTPGFERFPQTLLNGFRVGFEELSIDHLQATAQLLAEMQRLTAYVLQPIVLPWEEALNAEEPTILVSTEYQIPELDPLFAQDDSVFVTVDGDKRVDFEGSFTSATLQAFDTNGRNVLWLAEGDTDTSLSRLLASMHATGDGWYTLSGDFYTLSGEQPINLRLFSQDGQSVVPMLTEDDSNIRFIRLGVYVLLSFFVLLFLIWAYPKVVRGEPAI